MPRFHSIALLGSIAASAMLVAAPAAQAATELKVVTGLARNHDQIEVFFDHFVKPINADKKSPLSMKYMGGTEVTPLKQLGPAIKRGLFDLLMSPASYYAGNVAEGRYVAIANQGHKELRANGAYDALQEAWAKGINARILSWPYWNGTTFHIYLTEEPKLDDKTGISLVGQKIRATALYIPLLRPWAERPSSSRRARCLRRCSAAWSPVSPGRKGPSPNMAGKNTSKPKSPQVSGARRQCWS
jgi:hypothetical protein